MGRRTKINNKDSVSYYRNNNYIECEGRLKTESKRNVWSNIASKDHVEITKGKKIIRGMVDIINKSYISIVSQDKRYNIPFFVSANMIIRGITQHEGM